MNFGRFQKQNELDFLTPNDLKKIGKIKISVMDCEIISTHKIRILGCILSPVNSPESIISASSQENVTHKLNEINMYDQATNTGSQSKNSS